MRLSDHGGKMAAGLVGIIALGVVAAGANRPPYAPEQTALDGTVFSERYMPASVGWGSIPSAYSFSIDTDLGRKAVSVTNSKNFPKESVDALIEPGTRVQIQLDKKNLTDPNYTILSDKIRVLE